MKKFHFTHLLFFILITGFIQVPSTSWAQETIAQPGSRQGFLPSFQKLQKNNPGQLKKRPRALQQRRENRQDRRQAQYEWCLKRSRQFVATIENFIQNSGVEIVTRRYNTNCSVTRNIIRADGTSGNQTVQTGCRETIN